MIQTLNWYSKNQTFYFDMPILLCPYLINFVSKFRIHSPCTNFSISYLGTIHILRPLILGPIHPLHYVSIDTVLNISKNGHFLDPPTQSKCWRNTLMVPYQVCKPANKLRFPVLPSGSRILHILAKWQIWLFLVHWIKPILFT